jgi:hypothetical protein
LQRIVGRGGKDVILKNNWLLCNISFFEKFINTKLELCK